MGARIAYKRIAYWSDRNYPSVNKLADGASNLPMVGGSGSEALPNKNLFVYERARKT